MLSRLAENLQAEGLTRAHYITAFFLIGFEGGHRMRKTTLELHGLLYSEVEHALDGWRDADDPFVVGWRLGWKFEAGSSE